MFLLAIGAMDNEILRSRVDTLAARLQALEDREAIRALIASYGPLADSGDAERIAALWRKGGVYAVGAMGEARGHDEIAALITGKMHRSLMAQGCAHLLGPVAITLQGDRATARGHSIVFRHTEEGFEVFRVSANRWELARGAEGWKVMRRDNAVLDGDAEAQALLHPAS